ncbi:other FunK1 protein kinase [Rhizoctonia solani]|uniref:Other FunK1 protein kinase n=1 Tax=Rhizoctonia solani TaxID=456999 RepID=A0A8H7IC51_9AGAM|nr:other FunK1 protein kinase [Rhizoctonia solani]
MSATSHTPCSSDPHIVERGTDSESHNNTSQPTSARRKTPTPGSHVGAADTNTPFRSGSAQRTKESAGNSRSISQASRSHHPASNSTPAGAPNSTQPNMGKYLTDEMHGGIFCDPRFVENFLAPDERHKALVEQATSPRPGKFNSVLPKKPSGERRLYGPIMDVLNEIKTSVDDVRGNHGLGTLGPLFLDHHDTSFQSEDPEMSRIKPDLVMFEDATKSWETLAMPIEVKSKHTYLKVGMNQLARYARGIFAHQIHRRYVFGLVICRWAVTFVRFDRSGILHSKPIDMRAEADRFERAFAGLMMLDRDQFGYDTAFTVQVTEEGQREYYLDLPAEAVPAAQIGSEPAPAPELDTTSHPDADANDASSEKAPKARQLPPRRFKVMQRLCHRKSIRGRATIVLRIREVREWNQQQEGVRRGPAAIREKKARGAQVARGPWSARLYPEDDVARSKEKAGREVLKLLGRAYGLTRYRWHSDRLKQGGACHEPSATTCKECHDITPSPPMEQASNLESLDVPVPEDGGKQPPKYIEVDTDHYTKLLTYRMSRIYTWMLLESVGRLLWTAKDTRELLEAMLDGILGYWHAVNQGILHRDISDGNVLIDDSGDGDHQRDSQPDNATTAEDTQCDTQAESSIASDSHPMAKSRQALQVTLDKLGRERDMRGFLGDYDLFTTHSKMGPEFFGESFKRGWDDESNSGAEDDGDAIEAKPDAKRRKLNNDQLPSKSSGGNSREPARSVCEYSSGRASSQLFARKGTPTFMSIRVLRVDIGTPYVHHFMDDLQSFFWLLLWCVVEHRDINDGKNGTAVQPTRKAEELLAKLDRADSDFGVLCDSKEAILTGYFSDSRYLRNFSQYPPEKVFPEIVEIYTKALHEMSSSGAGVVSHN